MPEDLGTFLNKTTMALLGQGYRPELGVYDYSAITRANEMMGLATANLGQQVGDGIEDYTKQRKDLSARVKAGDFMLKYAEMTNPDQKDQFAALRNEMANPALSKSDQAAMADSISGMIALGTANDRFAKEFGMRGQELALRQREASELSKARQFDLSSAEQSREAKRIVAESVGPAKLQAAIDMAKRTRPDLLAAMPDVSAMAPDMQSQIADSIIQLLPPADKKKLVEKFPVMIDGVEGTLPAWVDETTGTASPVQMDGMVLPPKPGSESMTPEEMAANTPNPAFIPAVPAADRELKGLQIEKAKQEIGAGQTAATDKTTAAAATVAKSEEMISALNKLESHPGFNNLFGSNVGVPTWAPGSSGADAKALFNQVEGKGFIEAIQAMKGMGALSNAEGEKASMSYLGLTPAMSEGAAKTRIKELKSLVEQGIQRQKSGQLVNPDGTPKAAAQAGPGSSDLLNAWQNRPR